MSGGSAFGSLTNILIVGVVWAVLGVVLLKVNQFMTTLPLSVDCINTVTILEVAYGVSGVIYLLAVVINHWINSKSLASAQV
jgi:hypothetical protein